MFLKTQVLVERGNPSKRVKEFDRALMKRLSLASLYQPNLLLLLATTIASAQLNFLLSPLPCSPIEFFPRFTLTSLRSGLVENELCFPLIFNPVSAQNRV
jgi:hypothetical protein